jgi:thiol-disulfide isomerase/thioredoxin
MGRPKTIEITVFVMLACANLSLVAHAAPKLKVGDVPPEKLGRSESGQPIRLGDYHGKLVIVSFWASWCGPCRKELPLLAKIQKHATREKIAVFAVNWKESATQFRAITRALKDVDLTLVSDENGYFGDLYGVRAIPHMIIIGRDGRIASIHVGYSESEIPALADEINSLWAQPVAASTESAVP